MEEPGVLGTKWPVPVPELADRIAQLEIGPQDADLTFSKRLARECLWSPEFAYWVGVEYRRFLYLMAISDQELTPSEAVDMAWHLHLSYTRSYWDDLCGDVLQGRPLHHGPTQGGATEEARFKEAYARTFKFYWHVFDEAPPGDIWPPVATRFAHAGDMRTVSTAEYYVIPRRPSFIERFACASLGTAALGWAIFQPLGSAAPQFPYIAGIELVGGLFFAFVLWSYALTGKWPETSVSAGGGCGGCGGCGG